MSCAALLNFLNPGGDKDGCDDDLHDVGVEEWTAQFARSKRAYPQLMAAAVTETIPFYLHEGGKFPTTQRPEPQNLSSDPNEVINAWFSRSQITIEDAAVIHVKYLTPLCSPECFPRVGLSHSTPSQSPEVPSTLPT